MSCSKLFLNGREVIEAEILSISGPITAGTYTDTSGTIIQITANPIAASTAVIMDISADGTNWAAGAAALNISSRDNNCNAINVDNGLGVSVFTMDRLGNNSMAGTLIFTSGGTITTSSSGDLTLDPAGPGALVLNCPVINEVEAAITASVTQTQGQQPLTKTVSNVATVGNAGDVVTLPTAAAGLTIYVINNGANSMDVFPASGDDIDGTGVDTAVAQAAASRNTYIAIDATNWAKF